MAQKMLPGNVDNRDDIIEALTAEKKRLDGELLAAQVRIRALETVNAKAVGALKAQLEPLYRALQVIWGDIEILAGDTPTAGSGRTGPSFNGPEAAKWEAIKGRLSPKQREIVTAIQDLGGATLTQLAAASKMHYNTAKNCVTQLCNMGIIVRNGEELILKDI